TQVRPLGAIESGRQVELAGFRRGPGGAGQGGRQDVFFSFDRDDRRGGLPDEVLRGRPPEDDPAVFRLDEIEHASSFASDVRANVTVDVSVALLYVSRGADFHARVRGRRNCLRLPPARLESGSVPGPGRPPGTSHSSPSSETFRP